jgi:mannose-6-phosphate isomerase
VLRGGLTPKNVDVAELMRVLRFDEGKVDIIHGRDAGNGETVFATPSAEFELSRLQCSKDKKYHSGTRTGPDILIVMEGEVTATAHGDKLQIKMGESFFATQDTNYEITSQSLSAVLFKASLPSPR